MFRGFKGDIFNKWFNRLKFTNLFYLDENLQDKEANFPCSLDKVQDVTSPENISNLNNFHLIYLTNIKLYP
jgi:hypothetical protein